MAELPQALQQRLKSCRTLPSVPAVALKILDLCEQDEVGISEIAGVLARDPALAAKVLKVTNSAFYGVRSRVTTLERAVSILGTNATLSLSLSFSLVDSIRKSGKCGFDHASFWRRSVITAAAARTLSSVTGADNGEELFLAGLMQDIGMLVLNEAVPESYGQIVTSAGGDHRRLIDLERSGLGADHAEVGAWQLERWHIPEHLQNLVAASHAPETLQETDLAEYGKILTLAGHVAEIWANPHTAAAAETAGWKAIHLFGLTPDQFQQMLGDVAARLPEITSNMDLDIGGEAMIRQLLDQAREALVVLNLRSQQEVRFMQDLANRDGLTSLHNRTFLEEALPQMFESSTRNNHPLSAIFVDIDHFKMVNDTYGHQAGDLVLVSLAQTLRSAMRSSDLVARYGGEEFVCLLPNTDETALQAVAERIRATVASYPHLLGGGVEIRVTVSVGCATMSARHQFVSPLKLLEEADRCLYKAKRNGRNRVVVSTSPSVDGSGSDLVLACEQDTTCP